MLSLIVMFCTDILCTGQSVDDDLCHGKNSKIADFLRLGLLVIMCGHSYISNSKKSMCKKAVGKEIDYTRGIYKYIW